MSKLLGNTPPPPTPDELLTRLYADYAAEISETLWPWETARWHEMVFCILAAAAEPGTPVASLRELNDRLVELDLLDLADWATNQEDPDKAGQLQDMYTTLGTILKKSGFTAARTKTALDTINEAAQGLLRNYDGKVQHYFRSYGMQMLERIQTDFGFSQSDTAKQALAIWLQNSLNMPVAGRDAIIDQACEELGVTYHELLAAADRNDINVALMDDALRAFWDRTLRNQSIQGEDDD